MTTARPRTWLTALAAQISACGLFLLALLVVAPAFAGSVTLAWDPPTGPAPAGYFVYYGPAAGNYPTKINVGNQTTYTVSGLTAGATYHFAATDYDASGVESGFSNDVGATIPDIPPVASFTASTTSGPAPLALNFINTSTGNITSYAWTFGDGATSTIASPSHTYAAAGTYTVSLTVTGPGGSNTQTRSGYITVTTAAPVASFTGTPTAGAPPLTVVFSNTSTGSITGYAWNFGDGTSSTAANPTHAYSTAGVYTVSLTVTGPGGSNTQTRSGYITAAIGVPVASFSGTPTSGAPPLTVVFSNTSTGNITSYAWNFGDGTISTVASPTHAYSTAGVYTVSLTVTGPGGSNTQTRNNYITAATGTPVAQFNGTPTKAKVPLSVNFNNNSTGAITAYAWTFGDGGTSTSMAPSHVYAASGNYTVSLTVTGPGGSNTQTQTNYIKVTPAAKFKGTPTAGSAPLAVNLTDESVGTVTSYAWDFGDGTSSTLANPTKVYSAPGVYTVTLTVTGVGGSDTQTSTNYVTVTGSGPVASFTGTPTAGAPPLTVVFSNTSTGSITGYAWNFGDGTSSTAANPTHAYSAAGVYTVSLTVTGPGGSNTQTRNNYITAATGMPVASFTGTPTFGAPPLTAVFNNTSTGNITSYSWNFGDGASSTAANPIHAYSTAGVYSVSLTVTGPGGSNTMTRSNYVTVASTPGVANFQGLWWNAPASSESGWGLNIAHQGDTLFASWFTYDRNGRGWWLVMTASKVADNTYQGQFYETTGPPFSAAKFDPAQVKTAPVGTGTLTFSDASNGTFTYTIDKGGPVTQTKTITRQQFGPQPTCKFAGQSNLALATNYQDLWWTAPAGSESGWGMNVAHQGDTLFLTWFTYDLDGSPMWLVATATPTGTPSVYSGTLYRTAGARFDAFNPADVKQTAVGSVTVSFMNGNVASFAYSVDGVGQGTTTQSKWIMREVFNPPGTACQ